MSTSASLAVEVHTNASSRQSATPSLAVHDANDEDEEEDCCPCAQSARTACSREGLNAAAKPVAVFLQGIVVLAVSREWTDLLSIYLFRLHPVPYCATAEASSG